jgi:hypothetical protein
MKNLKQIKNWNLSLSPAEFNLNSPEEKKRFQRYLDLSSILRSCIDTVEISHESSKVIRLVLTDDLKPFLVKQFYLNSGLRYIPRLSEQDTSKNLILSLAEIIKTDILLKIEIEYENGSFEMRTFGELIPDISLSCLFKGYDLSLLNLRSLNQGITPVLFSESGFLTLHYESLILEKCQTRIPSGYMGKDTDVPVTCFEYIESFSKWLEGI